MKASEIWVERKAISHFPTVFSEDLFCRQVKNTGLFRKGLTRFSPQCFQDVKKKKKKKFNRFAAFIFLYLQTLSNFRKSEYRVTECDSSGSQ